MKNPNAENVGNLQAILKEVAVFLVWLSAVIIVVALLVGVTS